MNLNLRISDLGDVSLVLERLANECKDFQDVFENQERRIENLEDEVAELKEELEGLEPLREENTSLREKIDELEYRLAEFTILSSD